MIAWYRRKALFIFIFCSFFVRQSAVAAVEERSQTAINLSQTQNYLSDRSNTKWIARTTFECEAVNSASSEIYSFETRKYRISICQLGDDFYYYRRAKNSETEILIPAKVVYQSNIFQATDGNTIYFVGKHGDRYYSSVMHNTNEIVFEPELPSAALSQNFIEANSNLTKDSINAPQANNVSLELSKLETVPDSDKTCIREKSTLHPDLNGWQELIGSSPHTASQYATDNGHNFSYDERIPSLASIATKEGMVVNLNIATMSETIEEICIQSLMNGSLTDAN